METAQSYGNYGLTVLTKWMLQCSCSSSGMASTSSSSCCVKFSMGSSMGEAAMSISSAGEVWIADASGDALDNVAFGDALGDTDVAGTFAEEALGDGGVEESEILMCNTRFPNCFLKAPNFLSYSSFSRRRPEYVCAGRLLRISIPRQRSEYKASNGQFNPKHMSK